MVEIEYSLLTKISRNVPSLIEEYNPLTANGLFHALHYEEHPSRIAKVFKNFLKLLKYFSFFHDCKIHI